MPISDVYCHTIRQFRVQDGLSRIREMNAPAVHVVLPCPDRRVDADEETEPNHWRVVRLRSVKLLKRLCRVNAYPAAVAAVGLCGQSG